MKQIKLNLYPEGKTKALCMSFDDGRIYDRKLIEIFNKYGIKGTFHLHSSVIGKEGFVDADEIKELYKGHELSLHSHSHLTMAHTPKAQMLYDLQKNKQMLENIIEEEIAGFSYPMGSFSKELGEIMRDLGILYGRTTIATDSFKLPENFLFWHPTMHYARGTQKWSPDIVFSKDILINKAKEFTAYNEWICDKPIMYIWGHSYELEDNNDWEMMEEFCKYISEFKNIWFATSIEVADYINALNSLRFSADRDYAYNPSGISVWISVDDKPVEIPAGERKKF